MERVQQEIEKTLSQVERPGDAFRLWRDSGAFAVVAPPLAAMSDVALATIDLLPRATNPEEQHRTVNRLLALVLDVKLAVARDLLRELRFSNERVRWVSELVERWHALGAPIRDALASGAASSDAIVRRWVAAIGRTRIDAFFTVLDARVRAESGGAGPGATEGLGSLWERAAAHFAIRSKPAILLSTAAI